MSFARVVVDRLLIRLLASFEPLVGSSSIHIRRRLVLSFDRPIVVAVLDVCTLVIL
ncbi:hypothetical protein AOX55_00004262 (plasmid) [Sinorhizobium fredii CCBAU 25509]|nr:hypothetical protein AOX55_00004262 [Sinorhizobium fredii CCBAU 25509]